MSQWYFFYYIPAKACSAVLRQRAEPSVLSKGKSTENSIKASVLHWPLVCSHLSLVSVMWHPSAVGKGGHCRSCSWFQLRGLRHTSDTWSEAIRANGNLISVLGFSTTPQCWLCPALGLLFCEASAPLTSVCWLHSPPLKVPFAHAAHQGAWSCSQLLEKEEKWLFDLVFLSPFVMGKNKGLETSVYSVQGRSSKGVRKSC